MSAELVDFIAECLEPMGGINTRRMFGGVGLFKEKLIFGLLGFETFYFRVDAEIEADFIAEGCAPFLYTGKQGRTTKLPYYSLPEFLYDDAEEMLVWGQKAYAAALREDQKKPPSQRKA